MRFLLFETLCLHGIPIQSVRKAGRTKSEIEVDFVL